MRPQVIKPSLKKEVLSKTTSKGSITKKIKQKVVSPKKVKKNEEKQLSKGSKKVSKNDNGTKNQEKLSAEGENNAATSDDSKPETSKIILPRSESPNKKTKKIPKEKKVLSKTGTSNNSKKLKSKKVPVSKVDRKTLKNEDSQINSKTKNKISTDVKNVTPKFSKAKTIIKKGCGLNKKKKIENIGQKQDEIEKQEDKNINKEDNDDSKKNQITFDSNASKTRDDKKTNTKSEESFGINSNSCDSSTHGSSTSSASHANKLKTQKVDVERPPKFFTSNRSPRTVDIDIKCFKNSKGNLSMSERFLSMKCETKTDDKAKDKSTLNSLVSQGSDIDVYTFTEKVDSPKNILSDFRSPINKNVGRVRPIARVKGTIIDKKNDSEKKKYSTHKPIEEVVQQLKANKQSEVLNSNKHQASDTESNGDSNQNNDKEQPQSIISKSYKMVARKSSVTGNPFSPIKFSEDDSTLSNGSNASEVKKPLIKPKKQVNKSSISDDELDNSKFSLNTKTCESSDESTGESNDDNDAKESSGSENRKNEKTRSKKYKRITDIVKNSKSKELRELSKDSLIDLKDDSFLLGNEKPSKRRLKLLSMWMGPKKHRMASLNAIAKVHCLYENESRTHVELGLMKTVDRQIMPSTSKGVSPKKKEIKLKNTVKNESTSDSEYENRKVKKAESSESSDETPPQRSLRGVPGIRSAGKYWDPKSSTSSSEDSELELKKKPISPEKKKVGVKTSAKSDTEKPPTKMKKTAGVPVKKKRNRSEVIMDLKDMVVQKRMASLNATAILAASYEKRSPKSNKDDTTSDSCSDESYCQKSKNVQCSGVKSEIKNEDTKTEKEDSLGTDTKDSNQKVEVIVNQDTDVTITGVYSTHHHEGFCTVSGMQYRISSTSHTQTTATANCEKDACREEGGKYTPLSALSTMQPPAEATQPHTHSVPELGGLARRAAGCSSAFSAPTSAAHHDPPGYYQPAGPMIKESAADAERALARYHPPPHYHPPHPPVLQQYGPYYPAELCYGRYYRPPGPYHLPPPQPDAQMVGVGSEAYPPPQYYGTPPCYQHSPQRIPYVEYRGCPCPLNACPKNVLIGPATGKAPTGGGPDVPSALTAPGAAFRPKARACVDAVADTHGSGKDPPLGPQLPSGANAPHPCPLPAIGGASPKRELYDVRENLRLAGDIPGPAEALGPPSPARGSAGACAPQPPPIAPRRARLGKEMARRSLVGDDTGLLLSAPMPLMQHNEADDDVLAISPPICVPIDLSSSDERSTPLVDVKKENEGPLYSPPRKPDAQALKEHNCSTTLSDGNENTGASKAVKRRYSKSNLEIAMKDVQLQDGCKTNGIGEHVKLQKRRKVSSDQTDIIRIETTTKESKKKTPQKVRKVIKSPTMEKKSLKRKLEDSTNISLTKKLFTESTVDGDPRLKNIAALPEDLVATKPKTKSALLLDNLIRKNSVDRTDAKGYSSDKELNPAELFLSPKENATQTSKKVFNINNNVVDKNVSVNGVRPNTIAAVSQLLGNKLSSKNACKLEKVDSKITHNSKAVLKTLTEKPTLKEDYKTINLSNKQITQVQSETQMKSIESVKQKCEVTERISLPNKITEEIVVETTKISKPVNSKVVTTQSQNASSNDKLIDESQRNISSVNVPNLNVNDVTKEAEAFDKSTERLKLENKEKRHKASSEMKGKVEKVAKLLVSKKPAIKTDEATLLVEDACASPTPSVGRAGGRSRRRRSGALGTRRAKRSLKHCVEMLDLEPRAPPRWSNGWNWDGEHYVSKVYLNNDSRLDRAARCWSRMTHASGDRVARGDCVLLRASSARAQPFVARIARLWENPDDGEMMVSLVWYYRPEHTELGRQPGDSPDEVFASRHRDANSVACIEDKCYVLTFNEYCRYRKRLKAAEEGIKITPSIVPPMPASEINPAVATNDSKLPPTISPELVLFCRKIYDFRSKKIQVPNK